MTEKIELFSYLLDKKIIDVWVDNLSTPGYTDDHYIKYIEHFQYLIRNCDIYINEFNPDNVTEKQKSVLEDTLYSLYTFNVKTNFPKMDYSNPYIYIRYPLGVWVNTKTPDIIRGDKEKSFWIYLYHINRSIYVLDCTVSKLFEDRIGLTLSHKYQEVLIDIERRLRITYKKFCKTERSK